MTKMTKLFMVTLMVVAAFASFAMPITAEAKSSKLKTKKISVDATEQLTVDTIKLKKGQKVVFTVNNIEDVDDIVYDFRCKSIKVKTSKNGTKLTVTGKKKGVSGVRIYMGGDNLAAYRIEVK